MFPEFKDINREALTPMMQQYLREKDARPDCLLMFRLGDFYELFFDDAITASRELSLVLTRRDCGLEERAPMCGVPHHALDGYMAKLVERGYKVAVCEQVEDPAVAKGLVKREVVRVVTPGTVTDPGALDEQSYHYLVSIYQSDRYYGLAACDLSAGLFETCELTFGACAAKLLDETARFNPAEIICNARFADSELCAELLRICPVTLSIRPDVDFSRERVLSYKRIEAPEDSLWSRASAALLSYLEQTQFRIPDTLVKITSYVNEQYMNLDANCRRNLELTSTIRSQSRKGSLLWAIDRCQSSMGSRLLRHWLEQPLLNIHDIQIRQNAISELKDRFMLRQSVRELIKGIYDLERLSGKIALLSVNARDLKALAGLLGRLPELKALLKQFENEKIRTLNDQIHELPALRDQLDSALREELPLSVKEGGLIKQGYHSEVDELQDIRQNGKQWILDLEQRERDRSGIKSLKIKFNQVFGYSIEVTKSNLANVPPEYKRKQTLANAERYVTDELKEMEGKLLGAEQRLLSLEYEIFCQLRDQACQEVLKIQQTAQALAELDCLAGLAELAERERYCKPTLHTDRRLNIVGGRHPVVEKTLGNTSFVANDLKMDAESRCLMVLTGPNMGGKSTYMRQNALIVLLAQIGSFVPAERAEIGLCDRIFTRVGAADDLGAGQSTFMVEMSEVALILRQAGTRSLLILDEIGRGTSTYDGLSIAWAVVEHLADPAYLGCRALFATHYHELTDLADILPGVFNAHVSVAENKKEIVFLHRIVDGGSNDSYGIDVARLAGVPESVLHRSREILSLLEQNNKGKRLVLRKQQEVMEGQIDLYSSARQLNEHQAMIDQLLAIDLNVIRPLDAMAILSDLQDKAKGRG